MHRFNQLHPRWETEGSEDPAEAPTDPNSAPVAQYNPTFSANAPEGHGSATVLQPAPHAANLMVYAPQNTTGFTGHGIGPVQPPMYYSAQQPMYYVNPAPHGQPNPQWAGSGYAQPGGNLGGTYMHHQP